MYCWFKDTLSTIFKTSKKVYEVMFSFWKCIQYTIYRDKRVLLKKFPSDKINSTKNTLFFFLWAPTHHSFTFNSQFLYELKHKACIYTTLCGIFHFRFRFLSIKVYIFVQQNQMTLWLSNLVIPFKIKIIEKPHAVLHSDVWFFKCNKRF